MSRGTRRAPGPWSRFATRRLVQVALVVGALAVGGVAWAYWGASADAARIGRGIAACVNSPAGPTANVTSQGVVTVTWWATTLSNGHAVEGDLVRRFDASS